MEQANKSVTTIKSDDICQSLFIVYLRMFNDHQIQAPS